MTRRWDASNVPETLQRLGAQLTVPAYFAVPVAEPPWTRVVVVHEAPHMTSPTEGSRYGTTKPMLVPGRRSLRACPETVPLPGLTLMSNRGSATAGRCVHSWVAEAAHLLGHVASGQVAMCPDDVDRSGQPFPVGCQCGEHVGRRSRTCVRRVLHTVGYGAGAVLQSDPVPHEVTVMAEVSVTGMHCVTGLHCLVSAWAAPDPLAE